MYFGKQAITPLLKPPGSGLSPRDEVGNETSEVRNSALQTSGHTETSLLSPVPESEVGRPPDIKDEPRWGFSWYIFYTIQMTSILYITKILYMLNPDIEVFHVTFSKAVISIILLIVVLNKNLKYINWDSIDPRSYGALAFKSIQSVVSILISYNAMKYFSVSITGIVCSLTPLFAVFFAWILLGEFISCYTIASVHLVLACVCMVILGAEGEEKEHMEANMWALVALCAQPMLLGGGMIANRKMKRNHAFTLTCYTNVILLFTSIAGIYFTDLNYEFIHKLSLASWLLITLAGVMTIFEHVGKFMAFRYYKAAPLQKLSFLPNVWNFLIDIFVMHVDFATLQLVGFTVLFTYYTAELIHFYWIRDHEEDEK